MQKSQVVLYFEKVLPIPSHPWQFQIMAKKEVSQKLDKKNPLESNSRVKETDENQIKMGNFTLPSYF